MKQFEATPALDEFADAFVEAYNTAFESLARGLSVTQDLKSTSPAARLATETATRHYLRYGVNSPVVQTSAVCSIPYTPEVPDAPKCDVLLRLYRCWYAVDY